LLWILELTLALHSLSLSFMHHNFWKKIRFQLAFAYLQKEQN
jgi:hypothetical protein